jgi:hypothetical protein
VPHLFAFFLAKGWETSTLNNPPANPPRPWVGGYIQSPSATKFVNRFKEITVAVPWKGGKRPLFSIFSMASFYHLLTRLNDALSHLDLESAWLRSRAVSRYIGSGFAID